MIAGRRRGGLAIGAATRPGPAVLRAERAAGGWAVSGTAPWVTGWGMVDVLLVAARDADDVIVWSLVDLTAPASRAALAAEPLRLTAARASGTVTLHVDRLPVPDDRVLGLQPHADYLARDAESLAGNGFLAVGVAARAIAGLDAGVAAALGGELDAVRQALLDGTATTLPGARAAAAELAVRAAAALAVHDGAAAVLAGSRAERLQREAAFCLGFGSRPAIRSRLLQVLSGGAARSGTPTDRA